MGQRHGLDRCISVIANGQHFGFELGGLSPTRDTSRIHEYSPIVEWIPSSGHARLRAMSDGWTLMFDDPGRAFKAVRFSLP